MSLCRSTANLCSNGLSVLPCLSVLQDHLRTCIALRECRQQLTALDSELSARVSELVEETAEGGVEAAQMRQRISELEGASRSVSALESKLEMASGNEQAAKERYYDKARQLEEIYAEKIEMLINRVEELEVAKGERAARAEVRAEEQQAKRSFARDRAGLPREGREGAARERGRRAPSAERGRRAPSAERGRRAPSAERRRAPSKDRGGAGRRGRQERDMVDGRDDDEHARLLARRNGREGRGGAESGGQLMPRF